MADSAAIVLGASGSVGQALLAEVVRCGRFRPVIVMTRRALDPAFGPGGEERRVPDMDPESHVRAVVALDERACAAVGFSVLGIGNYPEMMALIAGAG